MKDSETKSTVANDEGQLVELTRQPVDLYKILKFEGLVGSGGEAKAAIAEGHVTLNGVVETQKRKKIVSGDIIEFGGVVYRIHCEAAIQPAKTEIVADADTGIAQTAEPRKEATIKPKRKKPAPKKAGRKAIGIKS